MITVCVQSSVYNYMYNVCATFCLGPLGSIKLFKMDTLLYCGDFKGK